MNKSNKLLILSGKEVIKILSNNDFQFVRQKGSHIILVKITINENGGKTKHSVVVPYHKEIDKGTLLEIIRQSRLPRELFTK